MIESLGSPVPLPAHPGAPLPADEKGSDAVPGDAPTPGRGALGPGRLGGPAATEADEVDSDENEAQAQAQACQGRHQQQGLGKEGGDRASEGLCAPSLSGRTRWV